MKRIIPVLLFVILIAALPIVSVAAQGTTPPADGVGIDLDFVGQLLQALILATLPVLAGAGVRWLVAKGDVEKAKLTTEQQYMLEVFTKTAIYAAEQMKFAGYIDDKLDYAEAQVQAWCDRNKIFINVDEIRVAIEAAVFTEFGEVAPDLG